VGCYAGCRKAPRENAALRGPPHATARGFAALANAGRSADEVETAANKNEVETAGNACRIADAEVDWGAGNAAAHLSGASPSSRRLITWQKGLLKKKTWQKAKQDCELQIHFSLSLKSNKNRIRMWVPKKNFKRIKQNRGAACRRVAAAKASCCAWPSSTMN